ncbi:IS3 family transposase [Paenibacillus sp. LMG 31458]|uniref:IS3 family transposase n=1 Tax=Paenibacillus phytorum TaxID=2654977 RepID=A0ABX1Y6V3_9BACL|nr:IS3 family transposase [Paenibacillus phytorum]
MKKGQKQLIDEVHRYIHFYNHKRFQKKLNNLSSVEYRTKAA